MGRCTAALTAVAVFVLAAPWAYSASNDGTLEKDRVPVPAIKPASKATRRIASAASSLSVRQEAPEVVEKPLPSGSAPAAGSAQPAGPLMLNGPMTTNGGEIILADPGDEALLNGESLQGDIPGMLDGSESGSYPFTGPYGAEALQNKPLVPGYWIDADFLAWTLQGFSVPALVTTSPPGTAPAEAGVLGQPGTSILIGDEMYNADWTLGMRFGGGIWFGECRVNGIEASVLGLKSIQTESWASSDGDMILARPYLNVQPGSVGQTSELIAYPDTYSGGVYVSAETKFQALEVSYRRSLLRERMDSVDVIAGWRYLRLEDTLYIQDGRTVLGGNTGLDAGTQLNEFDQFGTKNIFNGVNIGVIADRRWGRFDVELIGKLAIGRTTSQLSVDGSTTIIPAIDGADPTTYPAGLLAQQTNIGTFEKQYFALVPELNLNAGFQITRSLKATLGYTFLYWSAVARPGDQIDTSLNLSQLADTGLIGPARPEINWVSTGIWAQGVNAGLDYRF
jgi:hypothetical protein